MVTPAFGIWESCHPGVRVCTGNLREREWVRFLTLFRAMPILDLPFGLVEEFLPISSRTDS